MGFTVGPHAFSRTDALKTLQHATDLLDLYPAPVHGWQQARRARLAETLEGTDLGDDDALGTALATVWPELLDARTDLEAAGALPATARGPVAGLHLSAGGVPKHPRSRVDVDHGGVVGDQHAARQHHGRPWQALCLWSLQVIDQLAAAGHPIRAGAAGENVTIDGLDWPLVVPGARLRLGTVLCQVSSYALPCSKNARWFSDGDVSRIHHENGTLSRIYATVLEPGTIAVGDDAVLEP